MAVEQEKASERVSAILEAFYPGVFGGTAIAQTLFGLNEHLGGKLPYTVYPGVSTVVSQDSSRGEEKSGWKRQWTTK